MATVTAPPIRPAAEEFAPRITHPLGRLRRTIRTYVLIEGSALVLILACLWFWVSLGLDWGMFRLFGFDYLRPDGVAQAAAPVGANIFRGILLTVLIGGTLAIIGYKVIYRLAATFRESSLALVLERRFPRVLGDRLVTAVELADRGIARRYGFSQEMIDLTAEQAAERVDRLPLRRVFNWSRLVRTSGAAVFLVLSVFAFGLVATDTAATWMDRELALDNAYWPRDVIVEVPEFPDGTKAVTLGSELRVTFRPWHWVVATRKNYEGWHPARWADLGVTLDGYVLAEEKRQPFVDEPRPWELDGRPFAQEFFDALPETWKVLPLDQVEARVKAAQRVIAGEGPSPEGQAFLAELGFALIDHLRNRMRQVEEQGSTGQLDESTTGLIPEDWRSMPLPRLREYLTASRRLPAADIKRLRDLLSGRQVHPADAVQLIVASVQPMTPRLPTLVTLQSLQVEDRPLPFLTVTESDLAPLPADWRSLAPAALEQQLGEFAAKKSPERLAEAMIGRLKDLFEKELPRPADPGLADAAGHRRYFRQLKLPAKLTVEWKEDLSEVPAEIRKAPKEGTPDAKAIPNSTDHYHDFRKIEQPIQFRVLAEDSRSRWYTVKISSKPPALRSLKREQEEPGYLYGSNAPVRTGPHSVSLEGEDSRFEVPAGTKLTLRAVGHGPLTWCGVQLASQDEKSKPAKLTTHGLFAAVQPQDLAGLGGAFDLVGSWIAMSYVEDTNPFVAAIEQPRANGDEPSKFAITFKELTGDRLEVRLKFTDADGLEGKRKIVITPRRDEPPKFDQVPQFEIVRKEMITPYALIPFNGQISDTHGLLGAAYEVQVLKRLPQPNGTMAEVVVHTERMPLRTFQPFRAVGGPDGTDEDRRAIADSLDPAATVRPARPTWRVLRMPLPPGPMMLGNPFAFLAPPSVQIAKEHRFERVERTGGADVVMRNRLDDEYLSTPHLRIPPEPGVPDRSLQPPYRLRIGIVAIDNAASGDATNWALWQAQVFDPAPGDLVGRVKVGMPLVAGWAPGCLFPAAGPLGLYQPPLLDVPTIRGQENRSPQTFEFEVVHESDLIRDINKREIELKDRFEPIVNNALALNRTLENLRTDPMGVKASKVGELVNGVREARDGTDREIAREFRQTWRELWLNNCDEERRDRLNLRICKPLELLLDPRTKTAPEESEVMGQFVKTERALQDLANALENDPGKVPTELFIKALDETATLGRELSKIRDAMQSLIDYARAKEQLEIIIRTLNGNIDDIRKKKEEIIKIELGPKKP